MSRYKGYFNTVTDKTQSVNSPVLLEVILLIFSLGLLIGVGFIRYRLIYLASSDIGGIESNVIYSIQRYMAGYALYASPETAPYSITQYSPLYYRVVAALGLLMHTGPDAILGLYRLSRTVSLVANIVYAVLLFLLSNRFLANVKLSAVVAITAFVLLPPQSYSRPDSVYSLLVIATLYTVVRAIQANKPTPAYYWLTGAVCMAALAIATKQTGIILPLIVASYYAFFRGEWLKALSIGLAMGVLSVGFLLGLMPEHDPILLYVNIVKGVNQGLDWPSFKINIIDHYLRTYSIHNAVGLPLCVWLIRQAKSAHACLGWFGLVLFLFSLITSLKWGSALNYFNEYIALTGLVAAIYLQQRIAVLYELRFVGTLLIFSLIGWAVLPNMPNFNWPLALRSDALSEKPYEQQKEISDYLTDSLNLKPSDFVFVTQYNYTYLNGLLYRNCLIPQQDMVAAVMYPLKKINYAAFDKQISQKRIRFIITRFSETTTLFPGLTLDGYTLRRRFPEFDVYELQ